jgi:hypothetical protein
MIWFSVAIALLPQPVFGANATERPRLPCCFAAAGRGRYRRPHEKAAIFLSMLRLPQLLMLLLVLSVMACQGPSDWMAGIDRGRYEWVPVGGAKNDKAETTKKAQDLRDCEAPSGQAPAKPEAATDAVTITRAESSPMVEACMAGKGYNKVYQTRETMF